MTTGDFPLVEAVLRSQSNANAEFLHRGHIEQRVAALEAKVAQMEASLKAMNTPAAPPPPPCFNDD